MAKKSSYNRDNYYNLTELHELGFTKGMIRQLLGDWDLEKPVTLFRWNTTAKLYGKERVEAVMAAEEFEAALATADKRRAAAAKANDTKRSMTDELLRKYIDGIRVEKLADVTYEELLELGVKHRNYRDEATSNYYLGKPAQPADADEVDVWTKRRWAVNYIRHVHTNYDHADGLPGLMRETRGKVGSGEMYGEYKSAVLDKIAEAYPELKGECLNQKGGDDSSVYEEYWMAAQEMYGIRHIKR